MNSTNVENIDEWLPLDKLESGFDEYKLPRSARLVGRDLLLVLDDGTRQRYAFSDDATLKRTVTPPSGKAVTSTEQYEAIEVQPGLFFIDVVSSCEPEESVTLALDLSTGRTTVVTSHIGERVPGRPAVAHEFATAVVAGQPPFGPAHAPSKDLSGKRVLYVYSDDHAYEHVYLNEHWYTWHCLAGPERGLADTESCTTYKVRDDAYLFGWREKVIPCAAIVLVDLRGMRSTGKLHGYAEDGETVVNFSFSSRATHLNVTEYPAEVDPR